MLTKQDLIYRKLVTLREGTRILLRPLSIDDRQALVELYSQVTPEERDYMRHDVLDPDVIGGWIENLDYEKVLPLVAVLGSRIVGNTTLHLSTGYIRHIGEVRIYLAKDFRKRGLGTRMLEALADLARRQGIYMLMVQALTEQTHYIRAFQNAGFVMKCTFEDFFMMPNGEVKDVTILIHRLRPSDDEF